MLPFPTACLTPAYAGQTVGRDCGLAPSSLYPHARGANARPSWTRPGRTPLPPRTWGKRSSRQPSGALLPSTPTHVGQTRTGYGSTRAYALYPHARGANMRDVFLAMAGMPLPPRTWGKRALRPRSSHNAPSTPTHVGQTMRLVPASQRISLYPHARGANYSFSKSASICEPLPPRTWGKRDMTLG